jgi:branched-chain amino acid transport system permease protein
VTLVVEQVLNGLQLSAMLFLLSAGLTLVFGIMGVINLAHGSLYMIGAYASAWVAQRTGSFALAAAAGLGAAAAIGMVLELTILRRLYARDHVDQVLATFGLVLFFNQAVALLFGRQPIFVGIPAGLAGTLTVPPGVPYPAYRLAIIAAVVVAAGVLWVFINHTRAGMLVRAGATSREMVRALGVRIRALYTLVFGLGAGLAGLAGVLAGPVYSVQIGMGEQILIATFVVIVVGGIGSVRGAVLGALLVGIIDTVLRSWVPGLLHHVMRGPDADALAAGLASMGIYMLMAVVLLIRPRGLVPAHG